MLPPPPLEPEVMVTVTDCALEPPAPVQVSVKVVLVVRAGVVKVPLVFWVPLQPPDAVQEVALVLDQMRFTALPELTWVWSALSVTTGAGGAWATVSA